MVDLSIYVLSIAALAYALLQTWRYAGRLQVPRVVSVCIVVALLLYLAGVIPATLKVLTPAAAGGTLIVLSVLTSLLLHRASIRMARHADGSAGALHAGVDRTWQSGPWDNVAIALCVVAVVGMGPLIDLVRDLKRNVTNPDVTLAWDTVTYHLPTLVEMLQRRSLWGLQGAYSSYAFGFELIAGYPAIFFKSHSSFVIANAYSLAFLAAAIVLICRVLVRAINRSGAWRVNAVVTALLALALWCIVYPKQPAEMIGKNDVFIGALTLTILGLIIESGSSESAADPARARTLVLLAAAAMGLAAGTKPTGLLFAPLFAVLAFAATPRRSAIEGRLALASDIPIAPTDVPPPTPHARPIPPRHWLLRASSRVVVFTLISAAIGGIWYVRNLIEIHRFVAAEHTRYFDMSLLPNLKNRQLYRLHFTAVVSALAALTPVGMIALALLIRRRATSRSEGGLPFVAFIAYLLVALAIYSITPFVVFEQPKWQIRLGMPLFVGAVIAGALVVTWITSWRRWRTYPVALVGTAIAAAMFVLIPVRWSRKMESGMSGNDVVRQLPATGVYDWIDDTYADRSVRIYSAGLRPYGVVGKRWQNPVFGDPNSHLLFDTDDRRPGSQPLFRDLAAGARQTTITGRPRLFAVLQQFHPDLILIGIEPDPDWPLEKPQVEWMHKQPAAFEEVYSDPSASAFKVKDGWQTLAKDYPSPPEKPLKMGG